MKFLIEGGRPLYGQIEVKGAKNAALKMIAASILTKEPLRLSNVPDISDIKVMAQIIENLGSKVEREGEKLKIETANLSSFHPKDELVGLLRASIVLIGPLLARFGEVKISLPGGCLIGARPIDTHLDAFRQLGVSISEERGHYIFKKGRPKGKRVILKEMSVTATENIMMMATKIPGITEIRVAAAEPEIEDLALFLNKMGAKIEGAGTHNIRIKGVKELKGLSYEVMPDRIEAATWAILAAATKGEVEIKNINPLHLDLVLSKFKEANMNFKIKDNSLYIRPTTEFHPINLQTQPYPGFPTDLQAPLAVLLTQAKGTSYIFETLFEGRFNYAKELSKMGAFAKILDPHTLMIKGPRPLYGKEIRTYDLRAGASLIIAGLIAQGQTTIDKVEIIDRGYEKIDEKLKKLGAKILRLN